MLDKALRAWIHQKVKTRLRRVYFFSLTVRSCYVHTFKKILHLYQFTSIYASFIHQAITLTLPRLSLYKASH